MHIEQEASIPSSRFFIILFSSQIKQHIHVNVMKTWEQEQERDEIWIPQCAAAARFLLSKLLKDSTLDVHLEKLNFYTNGWRSLASPAFMKIEK
jgi:hypothetical protein